MIEHFAVPLLIDEIDDSSQELGIIKGQASVFGSLVDAIVPTQVETGAFKKSLAAHSDRIKILWQHDPAKPIGRPLQLFESPTGLTLEAKLNLGTQQGQEAFNLVRQGDLSDLSIGFDPVRASMRDGVRHIQEADLWEISLVTWGADPKARITETQSVGQQLADLLELLRFIDPDSASRSEQGDDLDEIIYRLSLLRQATQALAILPDSPASNLDTDAAEPNPAGSADAVGTQQQATILASSLSLSRRELRRAQLEFARLNY